MSCHDWALNGKTTIRWQSIEISGCFYVESPTSGRLPLTAMYPFNAQRTAHTQDKVEPSQDLTWLLGVHMPILLWLLGVPISVVLLLMLFGVF